MRHGATRGDPERRVEGRERFVEQHHRRLRRERAGERDPLLLSAGELVRRPVGVRRGQLDEVEHLAHPGRAGGGRPLRLRQPEADVGGDVEVREERALLRDVADPALLRRDRAALAGDDTVVEPDAAGCRREEARDQAEQRGLAAARGAEHGGEGALGDDEVDPVHGADVAEGVGDSRQLDPAHGASVSCRISSSVAGTEIATSSRAYGAAAP